MKAAITFYVLPILFTWGSREKKHIHRAFQSAQISLVSEHIGYFYHSNRVNLSHIASPIWLTHKRP